MSTPKLSDFFSTAPLPSHGPKWSSLWSQSYTPWDRGGPSLALHDLLLSRPDLVPPAANLLAASPGDSLPLALVPGCGRGHDALFLSASTVTPELFITVLGCVRSRWESVSRVVCHVGTTCCYCINSQDRLLMTPETSVKGNY
jgi:hypothetical protein